MNRRIDNAQLSIRGRSSTRSFDINNRGDAAGNGNIGVDIYPYVYDSKKGTLTDVAPIAGYADTSVVAISDKGTLAGSVLSLDGTTASGLILDKNGNATVFDHPDAVFETRARGINNRGQVAGYRDDPNDLFAPENGYIYDSKTGTFTDIVPSINTIAHGINSRGDVVGSSFFSGVIPRYPDPCGSSEFLVRRGWLREADGTVTFFIVNSSANTAARGGSDSGTIAVFYFDEAADSTFGLVVDLDGTQCQDITIASGDLVQLKGSTLTVVGGIKNSGEVVGSYDDGTTFVGYIARPK